jgi:hypothetical protein
MKKFLQNFVFSLLFIGIIYLPAARGYAEATKFTVTPELPRNQVSDATYFDLLVNKETVQELSTVIHNTSSEEITVAADALNSYTTSTGLISYQKEKTAEDYSGKSFSNFVSVSHKEIKIKPGEQRSVTFTLDMDDTEFSGEILGSFLFEEVETEESTSTSSQSGTSIESKYQLQIGVRMRQSLQELPKPDLHLIETEATENNGKATLKSSISNDQPVAFGKISVNTVIRDKNKEVVGGFEAEDFQYAPNSLLELYSEFDQEELKAGTYSIRIELTSAKGTWVFDDTVKINRATAKEINRMTIYAEAIAQKYTLLYWLLAIIIILIIIIILLLIKRRKNSEESE